MKYFVRMRNNAEGAEHGNVICGWHLMVNLMFSEGFPGLSGNSPPEFLSLSGKENTYHISRKTTFSCTRFRFQFVLYYVWVPSLRYREKLIPAGAPNAAKE